MPFLDYTEAHMLNCQNVDNILPEELRKIQIVHEIDIVTFLIFGFFACVGGIWLIRVYLTERAVQQPPGDILLMISLSDLLLSTHWFMSAGYMMLYHQGPSNTSAFCIINSFISIVAGTCEFVYNLAFCMYTFFVVRHVVEDKPMLKNKIIHILCALTCIGVLLFGYLTERVGLSLYGTCNFKQTRALGFGSIFLLLSYVFISAYTYCYFKIKVPVDSKCFKRMREEFQSYNILYIKVSFFIFSVLSISYFLVQMNCTYWQQPELNVFITIANIAKMSTPIALTIVRGRRDPQINKRLMNRFDKMRRWCEESRVFGCFWRLCRNQQHADSEINIARRRLIAHDQSEVGTEISEDAMGTVNGTCGPQSQNTHSINADFDADEHASAVPGSGRRGLSAARGTGLNNHLTRTPTNDNRGGALNSSTSQRFTTAGAQSGIYRSQIDDASVTDKFSSSSSSSGGNSNNSGSSNRNTSGSGATPGGGTAGNAQCIEIASLSVRRVIVIMSCILDQMKSLNTEIAQSKAGRRVQSVQQDTSNYQITYSPQNIEQIIPRQVKNMRTGTIAVTVHAKSVFASMNVQVKDIINAQRSLNVMSNLNELTLQFGQNQVEHDFEFTTQDRMVTLRTVPANHLEQLTALALNYQEYVRLNSASRLEVYLGAYTFHVNDQSESEIREINIVVQKSTRIFPQEIVVLKLDADATRSDRDVLRWKNELRIQDHEVYRLKHVLKDDLTFLRKNRLVNYRLVVHKLDWDKYKQLVGQTDDHSAIFEAHNLVSNILMPQFCYHIEIVGFVQSSRAASDAEAEAYEELFRTRVLDVVFQSENDNEFTIVQ